jgi:SAM-dependent methyltransferase
MPVQRTPGAAARAGRQTLERMLDRQLLDDNLRLAPMQPATALWRAIELGHLLGRAVLPTEGRGLDLGCGDGRIARLLRDRSAARWQLVGVDPDPGEAELARGSGVYESVLESSGESTGFAEGSFDFVFSNSVLEHVDELGPTLREVGRVLRPAGVFVFTVPSVAFPPNLGRPGRIARLATGARDAADYRAAVDVRLGHRRYLTVDEWNAALAEAGLEVTETSSYLTLAETRRWALLSNLTAGLLVRAVGRGRSPIELQRTLGLRRGTPALWIRALGEAIGRLGVLGLDGNARPGEPQSGLLVVACRTSADRSPQ